jgi:hypothetical protein
VIRRAARLVVLSAVCVVALAAPAAASEVSSAELRELAQLALTDATAEQALRQVTVVDGVEVDIDQLIGDDDATQSRIALLAALPPPSVAIDPGEPRDAAGAILEQDRFQRGVPGEGSGWLDSVIAWISDHIPRPVASLFRQRTAWLVLGAAALVLVIVSAVRTGSRRLVESEQASDVSAAVVRSAADLAGAADLAEQSGDYSTAVRLRFAATVKELGRLGVITSEQTTTAGMVRRTLARPDVDELSGSFERIAYAGSTGSRDEAAAARVGWKRVLAEVPTRG